MRSILNSFALPFLIATALTAGVLVACSGGSDGQPRPTTTPPPPPTVTPTATASVATAPTATATPATATPAPTAATPSPAPTAAPAHRPRTPTPTPTAAPATTATPVARPPPRRPCPLPSPPRHQRRRPLRGPSRLLDACGDEHAGAHAHARADTCSAALRHGRVARAAHLRPRRGARGGRAGEPRRPRDSRGRHRRGARGRWASLRTLRGRVRWCLSRSGSTCWMSRPAISRGGRWHPSRDPTRMATSPPMSASRRGTASSPSIDSSTTA